MPSRSVRRAFVTAGVVSLLAIPLSATAQRGVPPPPPPPSLTQGPPPSGTAFILGKVIDATSRSPISGAIVTMTGNVQPVLGPDGRPVAGPGGVPQNGVLPQRRVMTDGQGKYAFRDLPKGTYRLSATAFGYALGSYGQKRIDGPGRSLELGDGQKVGDATLPMFKFAALSGTILDDGGEPAVGVSVRILRTTDFTGKRRLSTGQQTQTDDRGAYRIGNLMPGDYAVVVPSTVVTMPVSVIDDVNQAMSAAAASSGGGGVPNPPIMTALRSSDAPGPSAIGFRVSDAMQVQFSGTPGIGLPPISTSLDNRVLAYQTVFYPSATTSSQATVISLAGGEDRSNVDIAMRLVRVVTVSGVLTGPNGPEPHFGLRLMAAGSEDMDTESGFETARTVTDGSGGFTFVGVPPGAYTIKGLKAPPPQQSVAIDRVNMAVQNGTMSAADAARLTQPPTLPSEPTLWAQTPVNIGETNLTGINVPLRMGLTVSGRLEFEGSATKPTADVLQRLRITLTPTDNRAMSPPPATVLNADGTFTTQGMAPGSYAMNLGQLTVPGANWRVKAIMSGGRNVALEPLFISSADIGGVTITYTDRPASELSGTIRLPQGAVNMNLSVMAIPIDYKAWLAAGMDARTGRSSSAQANGTYRLAGIPPGDYLVVAVDIDNVPTMSGIVKFFESLTALGTRITIAESDKKTLDLTLVTVR